VRADGLPTQHMRALAYWMAAPELGDVISMQVCGTEWVSHVTCRRKLMNELLGGNGGGNGWWGPVEVEGGEGTAGREGAAGHGAAGENGNGAGNGHGPGSGYVGMHPTHDIFNGMVARQKRALASSEGALLIDELTEWIDERIDADAEGHEVRRNHPAPERIAAQVALGYFLPHPVAPRIDFEPERLLRGRESLGWDLARAQAHRRVREGRGGTPAEDPDYRFAVVQSELYRRYLRLAADRFDVRPLAHYLKHLARWHLERERSEHVERVVRTLLERSGRGLGLETAR